MAPRDRSRPPLPIPLPIDDALPELLERLDADGAAVLVAPPGAGKTTRVPTAILDAGLAGRGDVIVLEPRRMAARLSAIRVAKERGVLVGENVGYQVRFDRKVSAKTQIRFVTEQLFIQLIFSNPNLTQTGVVILDEFHERHLATDVALALIARLRHRRDDLKVVVMSATIDPEPVASFLGCTVVRSEGRMFPVEISYQPAKSGVSLGRSVIAGVRSLASADTTGIAKTSTDKTTDGDQDSEDILVFLPGAREIREVAKEASNAKLNRRIVGLHGSLPLADQERALSPHGPAKLILATNVAETSITVPRIGAVIDSGLARIPRHDPWTGLGALRLEPVSQASATQRAGRAGRTRSGRCVRLFSESDFRRRPPSQLPAIARADLCATWLALADAEVDADSLDWFEPPPSAAVVAAEELLTSLGAMVAGTLTELGRQMARLPIHPRLARVVIEASRRGFATDGCLLAAIASERSLMTVRADPNAQIAGPSDVIATLDTINVALAGKQRLTANAARRYGLRLTATQQVLRVAAQLRSRLAADFKKATRDTPTRDTVSFEEAPWKCGDANVHRETTAELDRVLGIALLAGFSDRLARRRQAGSDRYVLANGKEARLSRSSVVTHLGSAAEFIVCIEVGQRLGGKPAGQDKSSRIHCASAVAADWILELFLDDIIETEECRWNSGQGRVNLGHRLSYRGLTLESSERPATASDGDRVADCLADAAVVLGIEKLLGPKDYQQWQNWCARVRFASMCDSTIAPPSTTLEVDTAVREYSSGKTRLDELCAGLVDFLKLPWLGSLGDIDRLAPACVAIPGRTRVPVHYSDDKDPWIESRLQDFFGTAEGPAVGGGQVKLILHLLAPNMRAISVTRDLASFWRNHYPTLRKALSRRYPRHGWPPDPVTAKPSRPQRRPRR